MTDNNTNSPNTQLEITDYAQDTPTGLTRRMGRPPAFTEDDIPRILYAIDVHNGFKTHIAQSLGTNLITLNKYLEKWPILQQALDEKKQETIEEVHDTLLDVIRNREKGYHLLIMFYLKTQAGWSETRNIVTENHTFNWDEKIKEAQAEHPEIVDGHFVSPDDFSGW